MLQPNFTQEQIDLLNTPPKADEIEKKQGLSYLKGQAAIVKANRIFGIGNWSYKQVGPIELTDTGIDNKNGNRVYLVSATVELNVRGCETFVEQGDCDSQGLNSAAISMARKGAVTDGVKRCLKNFGPAFGLNLYFNHPDQASSEPVNQPTQQQRQQPAPAATSRSVTQNSPAPVNRPTPAQNAPQPAPKPVQTVTSPPTPIAPPAKPTPVVEVIGEATYGCPKCDGPIELIRGIGTTTDPNEKYTGERCASRGCGYKMKYAA